MFKTHLQTGELAYVTGKEKGGQRTPEGVTGDRKVSQGSEHNEPGEAYLLASSPRTSCDPSISLWANFSSSSLK